MSLSLCVGLMINWQLVKGAAQFVKAKETGSVCFLRTMLDLTPCGVPQPIRDLDCPALHISSHRFEGGFDRSMLM